MNDLIIRVATSKKGNEYIALGVINPMGWFVALTFDANTISKATGKSMRELYNLELGDHTI